MFLSGRRGVVVGIKMQGPPRTVLRASSAVEGKSRQRDIV